MFGANYGTVLVNDNSLLHQGGNLRLYQYPRTGRRRLVWPYMNVRDPTVVGTLIIFNGGMSEERRSRFYPGLFGYSGSGDVVELSQPLGRQIEAQSSGATNYAFQVTGVSNDVISLRANQIPPIDRMKPISLSLLTSKEEILQMIAMAHSNGWRREYERVSYLIAR